MNTPYLLLLKQVWSFKFRQSLETLEMIRAKFPEDEEVSSIEVGLNIFAEVCNTMIRNEELKEVFVDRK